jgi:uncharacterized protein YneF (UPF0154 family)
MAVAGLVFGILGVAVFCWAGPTLGMVWAVGSSVSSSLTSGQPEVSVWPVWAVGLGAGVGLPALGVLFSIMGLIKGKAKGVCIGGLVTGGIGVLIGLIMTVGMAMAAKIAEKQTEAEPEMTQDYQNMINQLDDPAFQAQIEQAMDQAPGFQGGAVPVAPPAQPAEPPAQPAAPSGGAPQPTVTAQPAPAVPGQPAPPGLSPAPAPAGQAPASNP